MRAIQSLDINSLLDATARHADDAFDPYAERILEAARDELVHHGLRRTSLDRIASAAGVGRATLFRRFPNREALLTALAIREAKSAIAVVDERTANLEDPEQLVSAAVSGAITVLTGNDLVRRLLETDPELVLPIASSRGSFVLTIGSLYIAGFFRRLQGAGADIAGDVDVIAEMVARLVISLALNPSTLLPLDDPDRLQQVVSSTVLPTLGLGRSRGGNR